MPALRFSVYGPTLLVLHAETVRQTTGLCAHQVMVQTPRACFLVSRSVSQVVGLEDQSAHGKTRNDDKKGQGKAQNL